MVQGGSGDPLDVFIETGREKTLTPAWIWYLQACGANETNGCAKRDVLHYESDGARLFKEKIKCSGCSSLISVKDSKGNPILAKWVYHKLTCEILLYVLNI